jgi:hypothetical protein
VESVQSIEVLISQSQSSKHFFISLFQFSYSSETILFYFGLHISTIIFFCFFIESDKFQKLICFFYFRMERKNQQWSTDRNRFCKCVQSTYTFSSIIAQRKIFPFVWWEQWTLRNSHSMLSTHALKGYNGTTLNFFDKQPSDIIESINLLSPGIISYRILL